MLIHIHIRIWRERTCPKPNTPVSEISHWVINKICKYFHVTSRFRGLSTTGCVTHVEMKDSLLIFLITWARKFPIGVRSFCDQAIHYSLTGRSGRGLSWQAICAIWRTMTGHQVIRHRIPDRNATYPSLRTVTYHQDSYTSILLTPLELLIPSALCPIHFSLGFLKR